MNCPPLLLKIRKQVAMAEEWVLTFLLTVMILLACLQILLRDVFSSGLLWADPLLRYLVLWTGLIGAAVATRQEKHISIDIASHLIPEKLQPWFGVAINVFAAIACTGLTFASVLFINNEYLYGGGRTILGIPSWGMNLVFPLVFALITVRFMILAMGNIRVILKLPPCMPPAGQTEDKR